ncbi:uncharacterized protein LOC127130457 [Lathyrus oleraceus]|uniref:uncharacterized protein LOC127130457 n=1 Tax=Pisum sativum TaxID=3888 RepID=UPI0021D28DBD|nr:uncharacterized protein LOC127130457 [Pisum sativum]
MSQPSNSSPSKNMPCSRSAEPSNPNREDPVVDSVNTPHARRPKEIVSGFSSSIVLEERTKEGSRYVHNAIATIVTGILSGNHEVLGVSILLNTIEPDSVADQENTESLGKNISDDVEQIDAHKESNVDKPLDNVAGEEVHVTHDKRLALKWELAQNVLDCKDIMDLIQEVGLMKIVTQFSKCYEMLVKEFIVNLSEEYADGKSKEFRKVYVRGKCVNFSPSVINKYLGRPDEAQPELEVRKWPLKGKLVASKLSVKYAMLHKIGAANWVPTNHKSTVVVMLGKFIYAVGTKAKFDYGSYIFDQTLKDAGSFSVKGPIAFPSLICGIVLNQFPNILTENDFVKKKDSPMSFNHKLLLGTHVPDIVMTSGVSNQPGKAVVIAMLKETWRELEARKLNLEKLISSLEMTEGDVLADGGEFGEAVAVAEEAERQGEEGEADVSPDDGTDDDADSESDD